MLDKPKLQAAIAVAAFHACHLSLRFAKAVRQRLTCAKTRAEAYAFNHRSR